MALDFLDNKSVLITGGTGSFGQKCVQTLLKKSRARRVIIFSRDELKQSQMKTNIDDPEGRMRFFIGDVRDLERLERAFSRVDFVIHAAALKQVPALEYNPFEAVKTNILGTQNVINAAIDRGVKKVLLISTDKAANPANLYGATKLCAERLVISSNVYSQGLTSLSVVRYGNVLGSRGSLVEVLKQQKETGEVKLTHEDMTRFWITLEQGVDLVLMGLERMQGGEIFIPKLPSMKIMDFMTSVAPDAAIKVVGIRPGEKLHEMLVTPEEGRRTVELDYHFLVLPEHEGLKNLEHGGVAVPAGFYFSSDNNKNWLTSEGLKNLLGDLV